MTKAGKKELRSAAEEARRRQDEKKEHDAEKSKQRREDRKLNPVTENPTSPEKSYWPPTFHTEQRRLTTIAKRIYKLAQEYVDDNDGVTPSMLVLARDSLPAALKLLRMPDNWDMDGGIDGVDDNVTNTMTMLCGLAPTAGIRFNLEEISDIWAITNLLCIAEYCWWLEYWKDKYADMISACFLSEGIAVLTEIAQSDCHGKGMLCCDFLPKIVNNDCSADDILRICAAYKHVLLDPRTEDWTNGEVYSGIFDISTHLRWTQILCDNIVEPARNAAVEENIEIDCHCDFSSLLLRLSIALAKAKARTAAGLTCDQLGCLDDDKSNDTVRKLPTAEEWSFFLEVFERNSDAIDMCDCPVKEPLVRCELNKMATQHAEIDELFLRIETVDYESENITNESLRGAIISANKVLTLLQCREEYNIPEEIYDTSDYRTTKGTNKAFILRGQAYRAMGRFDDALDDFCKVIDFDAVCKSWHHLDELKMDASLKVIQVNQLHDLLS